MAETKSRDLSTVSAWISEHADQFKILTQKRDVDGPMQDRALEIGPHIHYRTRSRSVWGPGARLRTQISWRWNLS